MTVLSNDLVGTKQAIAGVIPTAGESQRRKLSEFSTEFDESDKGRSNNIKTASRSIDNIVIYPGETFSYNESVGPTIKRYGYEKATIYDKGTKKKGYGGGVCQVSSTLYNAAEKAGMEIIERHHHSLPVSYVPEGKDAATSYGGIDFKFVNNKSYPVKINSWVSANKLVIYFESA